MAIYKCHVFPILQAKFGDLQYQMLFLGQETQRSIFFWPIFSAKLSNNWLTSSDVEEFYLKPN